MVHNYSPRFTRALIYNFGINLKIQTENYKSIFQEPETVTSRF